MFTYIVRYTALMRKDEYDLLDEKHERTTLSGVDEKPHKKSPDTYAVSGLFVLLPVDRTWRHCRVQSSGLIGEPACCN